jgi:large subunit ribosomal protein L25
MSKHTKMVAETREKAGKGTARALRREEKIPAVIYGGKESPVSISLNNHDLTMEYNKGKMFTTLYEIEAGGASNVVLPRDIQLHPVTDNVMHIDFLRVTEKTKLVVSVPVNFINEDKCPGLESKGILNTVRYEVDLLCSAMNIPDQLDVDLTGKELNDSVNMSDADMPNGASSAITDRDVTIAVIAEPKKAAVVEDEAAEGESGEAAEGEEAGAEGSEESASE